MVVGNIGFRRGDFRRHLEEALQGHNSFPPLGQQINASNTGCGNHRLVSIHLVLVEKSHLVLAIAR